MATSEQDTRTLINNKIKLNKQKNITAPVMNGVLNLIVTFIVDLYNGLLAKINLIPVETSDTIRQKLGVDVLSGSNTGDQDLSQLQNISEKNTANGYAGLDNAGKVPASLLPSYVDDVLEFATLSVFPAIGESGKIYTDLSNNKIYRWSGSTYVNIAASPGSTDSVTEGATNLYFTNNRVLTTLLSGLSVINSLAISATDNVLAAFGKLQAQITTLNNNKVDKNGTDSLMSAAEHSKLNSIADNANNYVHPATHSASIIDQDETHRFLTDTQIATFAAKQNNLGYTPENIANKNAANGYAGLDATGKVPSTLLPSYVDDVLEFATLSAFPVIGESGKIYTDLSNNKIYRWSGSTYVNIAASPGSTAAVTEDPSFLYFTTSRVLNTILSGLSFASNLAITATDSIIVAFGKLQAQITAIKTTADAALSKSGGAMANTNLVTNLNADQLDGKHATDFAALVHSHDYLPNSSVPDITFGVKIGFYPTSAEVFIPFFKFGAEQTTEGSYVYGTFFSSRANAKNAAGNSASMEVKVFAKNSIWAAGSNQLEAYCDLLHQQASTTAYFATTLINGVLWFGLRYYSFQDYSLWFKGDTSNALSPIAYRTTYGSTSILNQEVNDSITQYYPNYRNQYHNGFLNYNSNNCNSAAVDWACKALSVASAAKVTNLNADLLDGLHSSAFCRTAGEVNLGGSLAAITTADFVAYLTTLGAFDKGYWVSRGSWNYSVNKYISDAPSPIVLAGAVVEVIGYTYAYTIRINTPTTFPAVVTGALVNRDYVYVNNGEDYSPGWRVMINDKTLASKTQIGALSATDYGKFIDNYTDWVASNTVFAQGNVSGTPTFDFTNRGIITATATANITNFTITGIATGHTCLLILTVNAGITVTMPTGWKKISTAAVESGKTNTFSFLNVDGTIKQVNVAAYE